MVRRYKRPFFHYFAAFLTLLFERGELMNQNNGTLGKLVFIFITASAPFITVMNPVLNLRLINAFVNHSQLIVHYDGRFNRI